VLEWLMSREYIDIHDGYYRAADKGREVLSRFMAKYTEFLHVFDVYCAVDLERGEFAFARYFDFDSDSSWKSYLNKEYWEDLRIAVAEFKKIDPVEVVF